MSAHIPVSLARRVRERASHRCEYCGLAQAGQLATFHLDHIQPRSEGGLTRFDNLALACVSCSLRKGARMDAVDPVTGETSRLFHPRRDRWETHFATTEDCELTGRTPVGRVTIALLDLNRVLAVAIRYEEKLRGRWPASETPA